MTKQILNNRTCIYSNKTYDRHELVRLVKINNKLVIDTKHTLPGRGYWLKYDGKVINEPKFIQILSKKVHCKIDQDFIKQLKDLNK